MACLLVLHQCTHLNIVTKFMLNYATQSPNGSSTLLCSCLLLTLLQHYIDEPASTIPAMLPHATLRDMGSA
jgi:hypothetical protein